ncbi:Phospholipase A1 member A [Halotydeus destructor]|nr:Phospholipase A1 member A [Halotydeus destructor]
MIETEERGERDFGILGKFNKTKSCTSVQRFFRVVALGTALATSPVYPDQVNQETKVKFMLFSDNNTLDQVLFYDSPKSDYRKMKFDPKKSIYILIHGWMDRYYKDCWTDLTMKLIHRKTDNNVIIVDWSATSMNLFINKVSANARLAGRQLYRFIWNLGLYVDLRYLKLVKYRLIGHSFGAQIAGIAGAEWFFNHQKRFRKLYAIDPSDQCFDRSEITLTMTQIINKQTDILSTASAKQVIVLHTDGEFAGTYHKYGHADIFVNGGGFQPSCLSAMDAFYSIEIFFLILCSHMRILYMIHTDHQVNKNSEHDCHPIAYSCDSYGDYAMGKCYNCTGCQCQLAGFDLQISNHPLSRDDLIPTPGPLAIDLRQYFSHPNWYLRMATQPPYCLYNYHVQIIAEVLPVNMKMDLVLISPTNGHRFETPIDTSYSSSFVLSVPVAQGFQGTFDEAELVYDDLPSTFFGSPVRFAVYTINVTYMSHFEQDVREKYSSVICTDFMTIPKLPEEVAMGTRVTLLFNQKQCAVNEKIIQDTVNYAIASQANNVEIHQDLKGGLYKCSDKRRINSIFHLN